MRSGLLRISQLGLTPCSDHHFTYFTFRIVEFAEYIDVVDRFAAFEDLVELVLPRAGILAHLSVVDCHGGLQGKALQDFQLRVGHRLGVGELVYLYPEFKS